MSICADGPRHIGIDNAACLNKTQQAILLAAHLPDNCNILDNNTTIHLQRRLCTGTMRKHWALQNNGDLWLDMVRSIYAKHYWAVDASKVKGHATADDIRNGICTEQEAAGNTVADEDADAGQALHGSDIVNISQWLHAR